MTAKPSLLLIAERSDLGSQRPNILFGANVKVVSAQVDSTAIDARIVNIAARASILIHVSSRDACRSGSYTI